MIFVVYRIQKISFKNDGKVELVFTDKSKLKVSQNLALEMNLRSDMELSHVEYQQLEGKIHIEKCRKKLLDYLSRRPHARKELRQKMARTRDYSYELIDALLDEAESQGFINDLEFARLFVEDSINLRKQDGPGKIRSHLSLKGVSSAIIDQVMLEFASDPEDEYEKIIQLALKKWRTYQSNLELHKRKARLYRFLISRGFPSHLVGNAVSEVSRQTGDY